MKDNQQEWITIEQAQRRTLRTRSSIQHWVFFGWVKSKYVDGNLMLLTKDIDHKHKTTRLRRTEAYYNQKREFDRIDKAEREAKAAAKAKRDAEAAAIAKAQRDAEAAAIAKDEAEAAAIAATEAAETAAMEAAAAEAAALAAEAVRYEEPAVLTDEARLLAIQQIAQISVCLAVLRLQCKLVPPELVSHLRDDLQWLQERARA